LRTFITNLCTDDAAGRRRCIIAQAVNTF